MRKLVLVDGNALLHRAFHATPPLTTSKGELVNAVYGFTNMLLRSWDDLQPDFMVVTWDMRAPTFRHQQYTQYKGTRGPADESLTSQYARVHQVIETLNIPEFSLSGYEADDLIGTLARQAIEDQKDLEVIIITGDKDIMQTINSRVKVLMPKKSLNDVGLYGEKEFEERFGFKPLQIIDYKGLAGDQSDNIPGVPGIGEVTATKLIQQFGSVENIYKTENLSTLPERTQRLLAEGAESATMSKSLATLDLNAPIKLDMTVCKVHNFDKDKAAELFRELEFKSLVTKITGSAKDPIKGDSKLIKEEVEEPARIQNQATTDLDGQVIPVLEQMSKNGVLVDLKFLNKFGAQLKEKLIALESEIYKTIGHEFNINSPKQLSEILFDELHLPVIKKTKTGRSTDEETLNELIDAHPAIPLLLQYRQLFKLVSTYIDVLPKAIGEDGRIHSTFNVEGAATGRLSSKDPNMQNIPIKGDLGVEIRKTFIAPQGKVLLAADYSQIELRIMAHLSDDMNLKKAFTDGFDIHSLTASKIFNVPVEQIDRQQRMVGKTMNFATLYGQGPHALSKQLKIDFQIARQYISEYFEQFPKVREWMSKTLEQGHKAGFVETISGRRRYIPELASVNRMLRSAGERAAINHPVQGSSADMIKIAMVEIARELGKGDCQMILQVHDELLFECNPKDLEKVAKMVKEKMENALPLSIPVVVDLKSGPNWGEMKALII